MTQADNEFAPNGMVATGVVLTAGDSLADLAGERRPDNHGKSSWTEAAPTITTAERLEMAAKLIGEISVDSSSEDAEGLAADLQYTYNTLTRLAREHNPSLGIATIGQVAADAGNALRDICHGAAFSSGWWIDTETGEDVRNWPPKFFSLWVSAKLLLIHSEVSEGTEGHRKGIADDKLPHRCMLEVELADAVIRIFDLSGGLGFDIGGAISEKLAFNASRADHKIENRTSAGGKSF